MKKQTVVVALSGGIDSAVSAALLQEQDFNVIGIFMKNWSSPIDGEDYCPWVEDQFSARTVAEHLNIPFYTFNFEKEYRARVLNYFLQEYQAGRTPNPDVMCNREIKFDLFLKKAKLLGADFIATGHYARIKRKNGEIELLRGFDSNKDQSYFLWGLTQEQLKSSLFPLGELTKPEVRKIGKLLKLPNATRKDSQGICFVGPIDVYEFLRQHISSKPGKVIDHNGREIGRHNGIFYYTIGQRHGLNLDKLKGTEKFPLYVSKLDAPTNTITVAPHDQLFSDHVVAGNLQWLSLPSKIGEMVDIQIRYRQKSVKAEIAELKNNRIRVQLKEQVWAVTPGQSLVIYKDDQLVGGGIIE